MAVELIKWLLPPYENYFLPSTVIRSGSRMPATSKKELLVTISHTGRHQHLSDRVRSYTLAGI